MTPHISSKKEDIANIVLMPGDPLRAKYIADNFLEDAKLVNSVRNMFAYTGYYKGKKITVFASGMGMPSIGIYSYELYHFYNVDTIIRIGSCGAYTEDLNIFDTILVNQSYTEGNFAYALNGSNKHIASSSSCINEIIEKAAKENSGMKKLDSTQKRYVNLPKKDYVEPASEQVIIEEEKNWFEKVVELLTEKIF